jgi:sugar lactone lactonase YvrE
VVVDISEVGGFTLGWGESLVWDDRRDRLYFADCAARTIHWLEGGEGDLHTYVAPSMPAGLVPLDDGRLLAALDDGLFAVDVDAATCDLVTPYPDELGGRANDACADLRGNVITGRLNLGPAEGSAWRWSASGGWRLLDDDISNTNGPAVAELDGVMTLIIGDTSADYFAYDYDDTTGDVGERRVFGAVGDLDGRPDGATMDADGGLWCALVQGAQLARFTTSGLDRRLAVPVENPTDVTFGGPRLDRLYVVAIDAGLLVIDGLDGRGRPEPRATLRGQAAS